MHRDVMEKWVNALRSGVYRQGTGYLRYAMSDGVPCYCVLGVLCQVHADETRSAAWLHEYVDGSQSYGRRGINHGQADWSTNALPQCVVQWAGMRSSGGRIPGGPTLAVLNDDGSTFARLADVIESQWEAL